MRVYKFLKDKYGIQAIRERCLKVSRVESLNDPFEFLPFDLSDPAVRKVFLGFKTSFSSDKCLLCFSRDWSNPVLWAHYADKHTGLCLGFDVREEDIFNMDYVDTPHDLKLEDLIESVATHDRGLVEKLMKSKFSHWKYEDEIRRWEKLGEPLGVNLFDTPKGIFRRFNQDLCLAEVVVGMRSKVKRSTLRRDMGSHFGNVVIKKATPAHSGFEMVQDDSEWND